MRRIERWPPTHYARNTYKTGSMSKIGSMSRKMRGRVRIAYLIWMLFLMQTMLQISTDPSSYLFAIALFGVIAVGIWPTARFLDRHLTSTRG